MTTTTFPTALASGALIDVDPVTRKATLVRCGWLMEIPSNDPEPCCRADQYLIVECTELVEAVQTGTCCRAGHLREAIEIAHAPFGSEWQREQQDRRDGEGW